MYRVITAACTARRNLGLSADVCLGLQLLTPALAINKRNLECMQSAVLVRFKSTEGLAAIHKLVVANRGEIACRVLTTARRLGVPTVALYSDADRHSKHVKLADEALHIGGAAARDSYLRSQAVLDVCQQAGGRSIHPGYGFLSENAAFADACHRAGVAFVGPPGDAIRAMGDKSEAKRIMSEAGVPVVPGYHGADQSAERLLHEAQLIGFPLLVKAVSGGGGKGMKLAHSLAEVPEAVASAKREAASSFGDDRVLLEKYIQRPRHVEVQVVCDSHGNAVYLFDRDCSVQRRHQKVIEEAPAPGLSEAFHKHIGEAAVRAAKAVGYVNAGTVEFIVDMGEPAKPFYFMEMNTRLQVEHPVTEEVSGVDLVEWQLRVAADLPLPLSQEALGGPRGHALEARLYAESPRKNFLPGAGVVRRWRIPANSSTFTPGHIAAVQPRAGATALPGLHIRVDSGVEEGDSVGTFYDPMIAKIIVWGPDRLSALEGLSGALAQTQVAGLPVNLEFLKRLASHPAFVSAEDLTTAFIKDNHEALMAPKNLSPRATAMAAVARHLMEVNESQTEVGGGPGGPWSIPDSKRLWGNLTRTFPGMVFPEGEGGQHADISMALKVVSAEVLQGFGLGFRDKDMHHAATPSSAIADMVFRAMSAESVEVTRITTKMETAAHDESSSSQKTGDLPSQQEAAVKVLGARLDPATGRLTAEVDGCQAAADVMMYRQGDSHVLAVWMDGQSFEFRWAVPSWSKDAGSVHHHSTGGKVVAPMPGRVVKLLVVEGQQVTATTPLVVLEAMKMEHPVVAPRAGVVRDVGVSVGGQVSDGQVLLWVDDAGEDQTPGQMPANAG